VIRAKKSLVPLGFSVKGKIRRIKTEFLPCIFLQERKACSIFSISMKTKNSLFAVPEPVIVNLRVLIC